MGGGWHHGCQPTGLLVISRCIIFCHVRKAKISLP